MKQLTTMKCAVAAFLFALLAMPTLTSCKALNDLLAIQESSITGVKSNQPLEQKYTQMGPFEVAVSKYPAGPQTKQYTLYYPVGDKASKYPLVVFSNGTGMKVSSYEVVLKHLASWGFICIGSEDGKSWSGKGCSESLDFALDLSKQANSPIYQRVDTERIGISGHSQGGVGAINAATLYDNSKLIRSLYGASTAKHALAVGLKWPYDVSKVRVPYFMLAATGGSDAGDGIDRNKGIAPLYSLKEHFNKVSVKAVMAQRRDVEHGQMLYVPNGYMVAWFLYTLNNDPTASGVFVGANPELKRNRNWQGSQDEELLAISSTELGIIRHVEEED